MNVSAFSPLDLPTNRPRVADMREEARFLWADGKWTPAAKIMHKADRLERGPRTASKMDWDKRAEAACRLAVGVYTRDQQRAFAVKHRGTFTASQIGAALGISRNVVIGWWNRA